MKEGREKELGEGRERSRWVWEGGGGGGGERVREEMSKLLL